ncbi:MAG: type II secretion system protein [Tepidisphaerales bacterium]
MARAAGTGYTSTMLQPSGVGTSVRRPGFTLIEILVVIGIIGVLLAILLPALERAREQANTVSCAANLSQIGLGLTLYAGDNHGNFPRTVYQPGAAPVAGTNASAANPFAPGGPQPNDTSAPFFLLMRTERLPAKLFADPYNDEVEYAPDAADPATHSNFTDFRKNLAYSYANPYPDANAVAAGYTLTGKMHAAFAVAADLNPGTGAGNNSRNHEGRGQNVLYADGHVEWKTSTKCGWNGDDIYVNKNGVVQASPVDATDSVLLPAGN